MKSLKNVFSIILIAFVLTIVGCSKSDDPTPSKSSILAPTTQSNLDKVKSTLTGTWTFSSMTITGMNSSNAQVSTDVTNCTYPANTFFRDTNWKSFVPEYKYVYVGTTVDITDLCGNGTLTNQTVNTTLNSNGTIRLSFSVGVNYDVNVSDITSTSIKGTVINDKGYNIIITFSKK